MPSAIEYFSFPHSLAWVGVASSPKGLFALLFGENEELIRTELFSLTPQAIPRDNLELRAKIENALAGQESWKDFTLDLQGTAFQRRVWAEVQKIPRGKTATYKDIAQRLGNPRSVRAVGSACARNVLAVAIPCHRVVRSDGKISGYRWGISLQEKLLNFEKSQAGRPCARLG